MVQNSYYPEEVLIEKMESGEYGWLDYVNHFSAEWQEELAAYCAKRALEINDAAAEEFVHFKSEQLEAAMESSEALTARPSVTEGLNIYIPDEA